MTFRFLSRAIARLFPGPLPRVALAATLTLSAAACGAGPSGKVDAPNAATGASPAAGAPADANGLSLVAPGDEPRRAMRYTFHPGSKERIKMDMRMTLAMAVGDKHAPPVAIPAIVTMMSENPKRLTAEGNLVHSFAIDSVDFAKDPSANPKVREALQRELPKLVGMSGEAETTPRGETLRAAFVIPPNVPEQIANLLEQTERSIREITVPFPEQPVGPGAKWTTKTSIHMNKMDMKRTANFTLSKLEGDRGTLDVSVDLGADPQDIVDPKGNRVHMDSMSGKGHGTVQFDLQRLVPTSDLDMQLEVAMSVEAEGQKQSLAITTTVGTHIEGAK